MAIATTNTKTTSWSKKVPKQGGKRNKGPTNEWSQSREEIYKRIQYKAGDWVSVTVNIRVKKFCKSVFWNK